MTPIVRRLAAVLAGLLAAGLALLGVDVTAAQELEITAGFVTVLGTVFAVVWAAVRAWLRRRFPDV